MRKINMEYGIVKVPSAFLYEEDKKSIADELLMGWAVKVLETETDHCRVVTHYGYEGYIKREALLEADREALADREKQRRLCVVTRAFADVLAEPKVQGEIKRTICRGGFADVGTEKVNGYCLVQLADGTKGYLPQVALSERKDSDAWLWKEQNADFFVKQTEDAGICEEKLRSEIVLNARRYLGTQYRWGGKSASGIDCSGLAFMSYQMAGVLIYRDAEIKEGYPVRAIEKEALKPGDLIYFPGHVAMYLGRDHYIHATGYEKSFGCVINSLNPADSDYRADLPPKICAYGSIFE